MTSNPIQHVEIDERAFAIFLLDGLYYLLQQDFPFRNGYIIEFCNRLWVRWQQMSDDEKDTYWERAADEIRRMRRNSRVDIYRDIMRDNPDPDDHHRHRQSRSFRDRS